MPEKLEDLYKMLVIKNQFGALETKQLREIYEDKDRYVTFLESISLLINNDSCFLVLDERFLDKVQDIIQIHRFSFDHPEAKDFINELIAYVNSVRAYPEPIKNILRNGYLVYHEEQRETSFRTHPEFVASLATDAVVFSALVNDRMDLIRNYDYALMSLNYLMKDYPELFKDENVRKRAEKIIEEADKNSHVLSTQKQRVKKTKKNYMNINNNMV